MDREGAPGDPRCPMDTWRHPVGTDRHDPQGDLVLRREPDIGGQQRIGTGNANVPN